MRFLSNPSLTLIDQGICSASTFAVFVILARVLVPDDFASFSLIFAAVMFLLGFQNALITMPLRVFGVGDEVFDQIASNAKLFILLSLSLSLVFFVTACFYLSAGTAILAALLLSSQFLYEFVKVRFYLLKEYKGLCFFDLQIHLFRIVNILVLMVVEALTLETALLVMAVAYFLSLHIFLKDRKNETESMKDCLTRNWQFGRWLIIENVSVNLSQRYYLFAVALLLNESVVAGLSCLQNLMNVVNVFVMGLSGYLLQQSREFVKLGQRERWRRFLLRSFTIVLGIVFVILLGMNLFSEALLKAVYGDYYGNFSQLMPLFSIVYFLLAFNSLASVVFRSLGDSKSGMLAKTAGALFLILTISPIIRHFGAQGAIISLMSTQGLWACGFILLFLVKFDHHASVFSTHRTSV